MSFSLAVCKNCETNEICMSIAFRLFFKWNNMDNPRIRDGGISEKYYVFILSQFNSNQNKISLNKTKKTYRYACVKWIWNKRYKL